MNNNIKQISRGGCFLHERKMNMKEKMSRELVCFKSKQRLFSLHEQSMNLKREKCLDNSSLYSL